MIYFDREGQAIPLERWAELVEDPTYRVLLHDILPNGRCVSTIWTGIDFRPRSLIFDTTVFAGCGDIRMLAQERWFTEREAREGHARLVEQWTTRPTEEATP